MGQPLYIGCLGCLENISTDLIWLPALCRLFDFLYCVSGCLVSLYVVVLNCPYTVLGRHRASVRRSYAEFDLLGRLYVGLFYSGNTDFIRNYKELRFKFATAQKLKSNHMNFWFFMFLSLSYISWTECSSEKNSSNNTGVFETRKL